MCSSDDVEENLTIAERLLNNAAGQGAGLAVLPENFAFMSEDDADKKNVAQPEGDSEMLAFLSGQARAHDMAIIGGTVVLLSEEPPGMRNACPVFGPGGDLLGMYDKIHLFEIDLPEESYREADMIVPGESVEPVDVAGWRVGLSICYDLRFPELYRRYSELGCQALAVPAAFTVPTGRAHWEVLLRARAIENQCYVLAAAQCGMHPGGRRTWGHSMIVDPWGEVLAACKGEEAMVVAEISMHRIDDVCRMLPALKHRRLVS
jgi:nitrilase